MSFVTLCRGKPHCSLYHMHGRLLGACVVKHRLKKKMFRRVERICHLMLLSVKVHWGGQEHSLLASLGQCPELLLNSREDPSQDSRVCTCIRWVQRTSPRLTVTGSVYNHSHTERVTRNSQTAEERRDQRELWLRKAPSSTANER